MCSEGWQPFPGDQEHESGLSVDSLAPLCYPWEEGFQQGFQNCAPAFEPCSQATLEKMCI